MDGDGGYLSGKANALDEAVELAQSDAGASIGRVETANGDATVTRTDGSTVKVEVGLEIFQGDVIATAAKSSVGVIFADNSTFSLADEGQMTIDEMIYDPGSQEGAATVSVASGVFTFISGQIAKTGVDAMVLNTPTATIGIRGTSLAANVGGKGGDVFTLLADPEPPQPAASGAIKGQAGDDILLAQAGGTQSGEVTISNSVGTQTLNQTNATTQVSSRFSPPSQPVVLPEAVVNRVYAAAVQVMRQTLATVSGNQEGGGGSTSESGGSTATEGGAGEQTGTEEGAAEGGTEQAANPEEQAVADAAVEAFEEALANGESLGSALNAAIEGATSEVAGLAAAADQGSLPADVGIGDIISSLSNPDVGNLPGGGDGSGPGGGGDGPGGTLGPAGPIGFADVFNEIFNDIFFEVFEETLEIVTEAVEEEVDNTVENFEQQAANNPTVTQTFSTSGSLTLTNNQNDYFLGSSGNEQLYLIGTAEAGDLFDGGGGGNDTVTFNTDGVSHVFRAVGIDRVNMSDVGSGSSFSLNFATAGALSISLTPNGTIAISGTSDGSTNANLDQSFTLVSDGSIGDTNTLSISGSSGNDTLTMDSGTHTIESMVGIEYFHMSNTVTTINSSLSGVTVDSSSGSSLTLAGAGNSITINSSATLTTLTGSGGTDSVTVSSSATVTNISNVESISGSSATLIGLANGGQTVSALSGSMTTFTGGTGDDSITSNSATITTLLGGSGTDTFTFGGTSNTISQMSGIETLIGGSGTDSVVLGSSQGALTVSGTIETLTGGSGTTDNITFASSGGTIGNVQNIAQITGGSGTDIVGFANTNNTVSMTNVESVTGASGNDLITLGAAQSSGTFSLGGGSDRVTLANGTNSISVSDVETVNGGTGADTVVVSGSTAATFTGGAGADTFTGGSGGDRIVFSGTNPSGLGSDAITNFSGATSFGGGSGEGDVLVLDSAVLSIGTLTYEEVSWDGSATAITLSNANATVIVLHGTAGTLTNAITALVAGNAAGDNPNGDAVILFNNSGASNQLQMVHTDDITSGSANVNTLATFTNNTTASETENLSSSDFSLVNLGVG